MDLILSWDAIFFACMLFVIIYHKKIFKICLLLFIIIKLPIKAYLANQFFYIFSTADINDKILTDKRLRRRIRYVLNKGTRINTKHKKRKNCCTSYATLYSFVLTPKNKNFPFFPHKKLKKNTLTGTLSVKELYVSRLVCPSICQRFS